MESEEPGLRLFCAAEGNSGSALRPTVAVFLVAFRHLSSSSLTDDPQTAFASPITLSLDHRFISPYSSFVSDFLSSSSSPLDLPPAVSAGLLCSLPSTQTQK